MSNRWLFKTEPEDYSYDDLERDRRVMWCGVRNSITLKNLREVRLGDQILIYHEGAENAVVGTAEAVTDAYPDPKEDDASVVVVEIKPRRKFAEPLLLAEIRASRALGDFDPARLPPLSVMPVSSMEWQVIQELSG
ncbi:MAG TPA: EVE domain-containing protein [Blastocatellia bacterium]|nr:EVE domain-containing protein [Blastocatellia bacterium]